MDLDDIRLKDIEELSGDEKKFVNESWSKLTTEEQDYYKPLHTEAGEFKLQFKTQDEFDKYVAGKAEEVLEQRKKQKEEAKRKTKAPEEEDFFPEGFKASGWNEAFKIAVPKIVEKTVSAIQSMNQKQRDQLDKINQEFDKEFDTIAEKDKSIPAKGSAERDTWEAEVADVGVKYKLHTMSDAYNVWKVLNANKESVGAESVSIATEGQPAKIANPSHISKGYGTGNTPPKTRYFVGQSRRIDDILDQRKREEGIEG